MFELFRGALLGLVQGLTEFFPVSSSGHLILVPSLLGWQDQGLAFDTVLHVGTLVALLWAFRKDLMQLIKRAIVDHDRGARSFMARVIVAAIPGVLLGGIFGGLIESVLRGPLPVAFNLAFWGIILFIADRLAARRKTAASDVQQVSWRQALSVGLAQSLALLPGTSRSGITMTGGLLAGLDRSTAVTFSFYVSIPTIAAAGGYGILKIIREPAALDAGGGIVPLIVGFFAAFVAGTWAIRFLRSYVAKHNFDVFVWYRLALAAIILVVVR